VVEVAALSVEDRLTALGLELPDRVQLPRVINGFSDLILELFGPEIGQHARSAIGVAELPWGIPVEVEAEVEVRA
jgi:enamine deaminase RidA (YjgF/YER057c/UK114 family)